MTKTKRGLFMKHRACRNVAVRICFSQEASVSAFASEKKHEKLRPHISAGHALVTPLLHLPLTHSLRGATSPRQHSTVRAPSPCRKFSAVETFPEESISYIAMTVSRYTRALKQGQRSLEGRTEVTYSSRDQCCLLHAAASYKSLGFFNCNTQT